MVMRHRWKRLRSGSSPAGRAEQDHKLNRPKATSGTELADAEQANGLNDMTPNHMNIVIVTLALISALFALWAFRKLMQKTEQSRLAWETFFRPLRWVGELALRAVAAIFNSRAELESNVKVLETLLPYPVIVLILSAYGMHIPEVSPISEGWATAWLCACLVGIVLCKRRLRLLKRKETEALIAAAKGRTEPEAPRQ